MEEDDSESCTEVGETEAEALAWTENNDRNQLCRVCANTNDYLIPIFEGEGLEHELHMKIDKHLPIKVEESDSLPVQMCYQCATTLIAWHDMVQGCVEADKRLKALLQENAAPPDTKKEINEIIEPQGIADDESSNGFNDGDDDDSMEAVPGTSQDAQATEVALEEISTPNEKSESADAFQEENTTDEGDTSRSRPLAFNDYRLALCSLKNKLEQRMRAQGKLHCNRTVCMAVNNEHNIEVCVKNEDSVREYAKEHCHIHVNKHLSIKIEDSSSDKELAIISESNESKTVRKSIRCLRNKSHNTCIHCGREFHRVYDLNRHVASHQIENDTVHQNEEEEQPVNHIVIKMKSVKEVKEYECKDCVKKFKLKDSYVRHRRIHTGERPFACVECSKTFTDSGGLSRHVKDVHTRIRKHPCDVCKKRFANRATLEDHMRTHTGERPYVCDTCGFMLKSKAALYFHCKVHVSVMPHICNYCEKTFRRRQELLAHITTHTGEKKHICEKCGKRFRVRGELIRHVMVHSEEKPFVCIECDLSFKQKRYLQSHVKSRHKD